MRWIYISPHLDDAILSCGGLIWEQTRNGIPVEIWTILAGYPDENTLTDFARLIHAEWKTGSAQETIKLRRAEDQRAVKRVSARGIFFDHFDCIYRRDADRQGLYTDIFVPPHAEDRKLTIKISEQIKNRLKADDIVVCPLGVGGHVDHVIVREAAEILHRPLQYYVDIPYAINKPDEVAQYAQGLTPAYAPISEEGVSAWIDAIAMYSSQITALFGTLEAMPVTIKKYWQAEQGIRLYRLR